jgi:hypothetical protein
MAQPALDQALSCDQNDRITSITTNAASGSIKHVWVGHLKQSQ